MDDRSFYLVVAIIFCTVLVVLASGFAGFEVHPGFYGIIGGIVGLLTLNAKNKVKPAEEVDTADADEEHYRKFGHYP